jgi:tartrate dehydrogenase/decarboxylase/D-malate dehydrogenase
MLLRHLGDADAADAIETAITGVLASSELRTPDIGGKATTTDVGEAIAAQVKAVAYENHK